MCEKGSNFEPATLMRTYAHSPALANSISRESQYWCAMPGYLLLSFRILHEIHRMNHHHFRLRIDRIFTFRVFTRGVAAGWASSLYGTSAPARACRMVGSAGCTWLDYGHEGQEYFQSQPIMFHFRGNSAGSLDACASHALASTHPIHIMSRPGHHPCMWWKYSYGPRSSFTLAPLFKITFQVTYLLNQQRNQAAIATAYAPGLMDCYE
jgi:hypothetical protein